MQPFRDLAPELDNVTMMPARDLSLVNMDPDFPLPYAGDGILLADYSPATTDVLVESFVGSPLLHVEVRHLGGALCVGSPDHGCLDTIDQPFLFFTFGIAGDAELKAAVDHHVDLLARETRTVGQRSPLPQLHGVAGRPADDLPGDELAASATGEIDLRP